MSRETEIHEALKRRAAAARLARASDDRIEQVLLESPRHGITGGEERKTPGARARRRLAGWRPARTVTAALACLAFSGTALAASGLWDPGFGSESPHGPIITAPAAIPAAMRQELGVLRRDPSARDRSPAIEAAVRKIGVSPAFGVSGIRPDSVRYLAPGVGGIPTILLLAERANRHFDVTGEPICIFRSLGHPNENPATCFGLPEVIDGNATSFGFDLTKRIATVEGLVPDGVAAVRVKYRGHELTDRVSNNYFYVEFTIHGSDYWKYVHPKVTWQGPGGAVVMPPRR